jgi:Family of unknown function (DUF6768)
MMDEFEKKIAQALERDAAEQFEKMGADQSIFEMMTGGFRGRNRWMNAMVAVVMLVMFAITIYAIIQFLEAEETRDMLRWGFGAGITFSMMGFLKLWFWLDMQKNSIVREVKRVEIQVASLAAKFGRDAG